MRRSLRRQLRWFRAYAVVSSFVLAGLAAMTFRQAVRAAEPPGELTVQRLNVVDADGTLRLVISNKDRMHPGVIDGKVIKRERKVAGLIFFNDQGDEVGGLTFTGQRKADGTRQADAGIMFDQLKQDQTIGFSYSEGGGRRTAGFEVWDPPDANIGELIEKLNAANAIGDPGQRAAAVTAARRSFPPRPRRVFVGKDADHQAVVSLADGLGKPRLRLSVDAAGAAGIEFLDAAGKVVSRIPK